MKPYLFAAQWADGSYEVIVSQNGEAERRYMLARGLGGPVRKVDADGTGDPPV